MLNTIVIIFNMNPTSLDKLIVSYCHSINKFPDLYDTHLDCLTNILVDHNLFCTNPIVRFLNRHFVSFLVWSCYNEIATVLNNGRWSVNLELIENELVNNWKFSLVSSFNQALMLYSILKFIGQYTNNYTTYTRCYSIMRKIPDIESPYIMSPRQIEHLYAFNRNFCSNRKCPKTNKITGSNRLIDFHSRGYYLKSRINIQHLHYKNCRYYHSYEMLCNNPTTITCLYYLHSLYYRNDAKQNNDPVKLIYDKLCNSEIEKDDIMIDAEHPKLNKNFLQKYHNKIADYNIQQLLEETMNKIIYCQVSFDYFMVYNEFFIQKSIDKINEDVLHLLDRDTVNGQNDEELLSIIKEIIPKIPNEKTIGLLRKLFTDEFIKPFGSIFSFILSLCNKYNANWVKYIMSEYMAQHLINIQIAEYNKSLIDNACSQITHNHKFIDMIILRQHRDRMADIQGCVQV